MLLSTGVSIHHVCWRGWLNDYNQADVLLHCVIDNYLCMDTQHIFRLNHRRIKIMLKLPLQTKKITLISHHSETTSCLIICQTYLVKRPSSTLSESISISQSVSISRYQSVSVSVSIILIDQSNVTTKKSLAAIVKNGVALRMCKSYLQLKCESEFCDLHYQQYFKS